MPLRSTPSARTADAFRPISRTRPRARRTSDQGRPTSRLARRRAAAAPAGFTYRHRSSASRSQTWSGTAARTAGTAAPSSGTASGQASPAAGAVPDDGVAARTVSSSRASRASSRSVRSAFAPSSRQTCCLASASSRRRAWADARVCVMSWSAPTAPKIRWPGPGERPGREVQVQGLPVGAPELPFELPVVPEVGLGRERGAPDLLEVRDCGRVRDQELAGPAHRDHPDREGLDHGREQGPVPLGLAEQGAQALDLLARVLVGGPLLVDADPDRVSRLVLAGDGPVHDPADLAVPRHDPAAEGLGDGAVAEDRGPEPVLVVGMAAPDQEGRVGPVGIGRVPGQVLARRRDVLAVAVGADPGLEVGRGLEHAREEATAAALVRHPGDPRGPPLDVAVDPAREDPDRPLSVRRRRGRHGRRRDDHVVRGEVVLLVDREPAPSEGLEQGQEPFVGLHGEETGHGDAPCGRV